MENRMNKFWYGIRNIRSQLQMLRVGAGVLLAKCFGVLVSHGSLYAVLIRADETRTDLGCVGKRVVTTAGINYLVDDWDGGAATIDDFNFHDSGTGAVAEAIGDTTLGTPAGPARVSGTKAQPSANIWQSIATIAYTATLAITEHGFFSAATAGTLWDRTVFTAINVVSGDSIQFTYECTFTAGS